METRVFEKLNKISTLQWTCVVFCVACLTYIQTINHGFVLDDGALIVHNKLVQSLANIKEIITSNAWEGAGKNNSVYRPLTGVSFALNYAATGLNPWSYHLVNIILHACVAALLFRLALVWGLARHTAGLAAIFFALHPIHVEAVANIAGRKELLASLFIVLMLLAHHQSLIKRGRWTFMATFFSRLLCCQKRRAH